MSDVVYGLRTAVFRLTTLHLPDSCRIELTHIARAVAFFEGQGGPSALLSVASQRFANHPLSPPSPLTISKIAPCKIHPTKKEMEAHYEWEGGFGKRAAVPHYRFVV